VEDAEQNLTPRLAAGTAVARVEADGGSLMAVEKTLRLESTERFPLSHRHYHGVLE
jgi:hypothetical protein